MGKAGDLDEIPYRQIVESTNDGIWLLDQQGKTQFANSQMQAFLGYSMAEMIGKHPIDFMDPDMAEMIEERLKIRSVGVAETYEARYRRKDGTDLWVSTTGSPIYSRSGEVVGSLGVHKDITEKKRLERQMALQQAQIQTASKLSALGEMAGGVAHEINNPLTTILMLSSKLEKMVELGQPIEPEFLKWTSKQIANTSRRIVKIVDGLRTFSRDGTNDPFRAEAINGIIEDTLSLCYERFQNSSVSLTVKLLPANIDIECKATQISQAVLNLLNNAYHAVRGLPEKWVRVELLDFPDHVEILVIDSGRGIPPEVKAKMFVPFYTTKDVGEGTGLGLSIALGIAKAHRGTLTLDDSRGNTCFRINLPKRQASNLD